MSRRANGEGSIYQRRDGRWCGVVSTPDGGRKTFYGRTRNEVARRLSAALRDLEQGVVPVPERLTTGAFLEHWLRESARPAVRPSTFASYAGIVRLHLLPGLGSIPLTRLGPLHVQVVMNQKLEGGLSPRRVQYIRAVLRRALGQALKWGLVSRNVATLVDPPRSERPEVHPFDPDEARRFLAAVRGDRLEALYAAALALGLRQGEALGLRWDDVDLARRTLSIRMALQRIEGRLQLVEPKTKLSRRAVHLPSAPVRALEEHRARQLEERLRAGERWEENGLVFTTPVGRPLDASSVTHRFQRIVAAAGLRRQRFHDLRHACASLLLAQGVSPRVVMEVLGHSQISLTLNTYSHVIPALQREAADRMDSVISDRS